MELRTTPRATLSAGLDKETYVTTILESIRRYNERSTTMKTSLILSIDRRNDQETAMDVVTLAERYRNQGVVGIDLVSIPAYRASFSDRLNTDTSVSVATHLKAQYQCSRQLSRS